MSTRGTMTMGRMDEWSAWQRWTVWLVGWALYIGAFWLLLAIDGVALRVVALAGICAGLLVLTYSSKAVLNERIRNIDRWQLRTMLPPFLISSLLVLYVMPLAAQVTTTWVKALMVLSPMLPLVLVAWSMVRYVNRCDEMERRQHLEAAGVAVLVVSLGCAALGFLAAAKLIVVNGAIVLLLMLPALCVVYGVACTVSKWRNRAR